MAGLAPAPLPHLGFNLPPGSILAAAQGNYTLTGNAVGLYYRGYGVGAPAPLPSMGFLLTTATSGVRNPAPIPSLSSLFGGVHAYVLTCAQGTYTLTGSEVLADYQVTLAKGTYSLTGQDVALKPARNLQITAGSYGVNGQSVNLVRAIKMLISQGTYTLTGQAVNLRYASGKTLVAFSGSYTLTGNDLNLLRTYRMSLGSGTYTQTGQSINIIYTERVKEIVPYLIGMLEQQARDVITALHCVANVSGSGGTVVSQSPPHMTQVLRGSTISVTMGGVVNYTKLNRRRGLPPYSTNEGLR
jgi:hypothetical protein